MLDDKIISASEVVLKIAIWSLVVGALEWLFGKTGDEIFTRIYWLAAGAAGIYVTAVRKAS